MIFLQNLAGFSGRVLGSIDLGRRKGDPVMKRHRDTNPFGTRGQLI